MSGLRIVALRLLCPDPGRTARFLVDALGARELADGTGVAIGRQRVLLDRTEASPAAPAPSNATSFQHFAIVVSDMAQACRRLGGVAGWTAISRAGPERLPVSSGGVEAFKFRDPDGHPLEFLRFPDGAVPEAWRGATGLHLGIDHTAIGVADTERSVAFYEGLGFSVSSRGTNRGIEQARMDDVPDPVVEVTGLAPPGGAPPHLELLCYRAPGSIAAPLDDRSVLATRIHLADPGGAADAVPTTRQDPDGHRLLVG